MAGNRLFVTVPNFQYSADYFPQIVSRLRQYGRVYAPEITNEDPREPFIQGERAFALVGHYNNVLLDMVANALYLRSATIPETVKLILETINGQLYPAGPGRVDMVAELTSTYSTTTRLLEAYRKFATRRNADLPETIFENMTAIDTTKRTDKIGHAYALQLNKQGTQAELSSVYPDVISDTTTAPFRIIDLNHYITVHSTDLGNDADELRIIEVFDETAPGSGLYESVRVEGGSFITESNVEWYIKRITSDIAPDWNAGIANDPFPGGPLVGDAIYIGHPDVMFDRIDLTLSAPVTPGYIATWEFYDPTESSISPDNVSVGVGTITFQIDSLLGTENQNLSHITVEYVPTGAKFKAFSFYSASSNYVTVNSYMGQTTPSTDEGDYLISAAWRPVPNINDETYSSPSTWALSGKLEFDLPQSQTDSWYKYSLYDHDDGEKKSCFFVRLRVVDSVPGSSPVPSTVEIHRGSQYVIKNLIQGKTVEDSPYSSTAEASQEFLLAQKPYVLASGRVFVDEGGGEYEWSVLTTLVRSGSSDRHCIIEPQTDGTAVLKFGDGTNGKIPAIGSNNIRYIYRIGADTNGNIGANTLVENRDGVGVFKRIWNPRQGKYWIEADWSSAAALERAKVRGPKKLRTLNRAVSASDCETLATTFLTRNGVRPVARARAYEESFGPKTIELVVAGVNGASLSSDERAELEEYFNGGTTYGYGGVLVANSRVYVTNYSPKQIPLVARVEAYPVITEAMVMQLLSSIINPTALESDGRSYTWRFGQNVPLSRLAAEIFQLAPGNIFDVDFTSPTSDISLSSKELPIFDFVNSSVVITSPSFIVASS